MALIEKVTRRIEVDELNGSHIHIRDTTHIVDDSTGEIVHRNVTHHRKVIDCGDDAAAAREGLTDFANTVWTSAVRQKAKGKPK